MYDCPRCPASPAAYGLTSINGFHARAPHESGQETADATGADLRLRSWLPQGHLHVLRSSLPATATKGRACLVRR